MFDSKAVLLTATDQDIFVCPAGLEGSVHDIYLSCIMTFGSSFSLKLYKASTATTIAIVTDRAIGQNAEYKLPAKINMQPGDKLIGRAGNLNAVTIFCSLYLDTGSTIVSAFNGRGSYSSVANYVPGDLVTDGTASYLARIASLNKAPAANPTEWMLLGTGAKATAYDIFTGTDDAKFVTSKSIFDAAAFIALTDAATIAVDLATGSNFSVTLGGNRTLGAPTNAKPGQSGVIEVTQDGSGSRTLAYNTAYKFPGGAPSLSPGANKVDLISYVVKAGPATPILRCVLAKDFA